MSDTNLKPTQRRILRRLHPSEQLLLLLAGDISAAVIALGVALFFWGQQDKWLNFSIQFIRERVPAWFYLLPLIWILMLIEIYDLRRASRRDETIQTILIAVIVSFGFYLLLYFTRSNPKTLPRQSVAIFIIIISVLTTAWRLLYIRIFTAPTLMRRILIVGAGRSGSTLVHIIKSLNPPPFILVGLIDDDLEKIGNQIEGYPIIGSHAELLDAIQKENITDLVFAITGVVNNEMLQSMWLAEEQGIEVTTMPTMYEEMLGRVPISLLHPDWVLRSFVDQAHTGDFYELVKRIVDIIGGLIGVIILVILFPLIALAIMIDSGVPIIILQDRLGKNGEVIKIIKFRSMRQDAESDGKAQPAIKNDKRINRVGLFLRKSHLDEFPQFINVLRGDMSLVGPRAERIELVNEYQTKVPFYRARLLVKPGLSGWAQINFSYASTVEETKIKLEYDLYYIKHRNLILDLFILLRSIGSILGLKGQ